MFHEQRSNECPLPERLRPRALGDVYGQEHIWKNDSPLRRLVATDSVSALLFWGPPGTGKTTIAHLIGHESQRKLVVISAVHATVKDIRAILDDSKSAQQEGLKGHLLFVDEIHRLSKSQQDVLLPGLESGVVRFIGATTENPSFSVNNAILSRCLTFNLKPLSEDALIQIQRRALASGDQSLTGVHASDDVLAILAHNARGDGRQCLNLLAAAAACANKAQDGTRAITPGVLEDLAASIPLRYDRDGYQHYDVISAFIKSIRASHPDAAVYYLARMIEAGEDPLFIARRLLISASEDVGNANPTALLVADSTFKAVEVLGLPEARIALSQCTTYLAASPKSNRAYNAINVALAEVRSTGPLEIPLHLRNAPTKFMKDQGFGTGYAYAHTDPEAAKRLAYLPANLKGRRYYEPIPVGAERQLIETLKHLRPVAD
jgi:putative ATPase